MQPKRIALVTGGNQGVGLQVAKELVANGVTVLVGSRNFEHGKTAARGISVTSGDPLAESLSRDRRSSMRFRASSTGAY
jgi:NAD(P)-dependent dehydrogenase (short-subunit alcohol dehydrogenase family)